MKIAVWRTGHEVADRVAEAVYEGLKKNSSCECVKRQTECEPRELESAIAEAEIHICYGILRGADAIFRMAAATNKRWFNIDKGYWKPGHYNGYYRISLRGTQQTFGLDGLKPHYERWDALGLEIMPAKEMHGNHTLMIPPTNYVCEWFDINSNNWIAQTGHDECLANRNNYSAHARHKDDESPLQNQLDNCSRVTTFNSSVGWEALRQGIPVVSDPTHSIVGAYQKMLDIDLSKDSNERRKFFAIQAGLQLRLDEIKSGALWHLLQTLLTIN